MNKKVNAEKPKEYNIDSFDKLINVANAENIDRLSIDLLQPFHGGNFGNVSTI
jgi:hypothetical protein